MDEKDENVTQAEMDLFSKGLEYVRLLFDAAPWKPVTYMRGVLYEYIKDSWKFLDILIDLCHALNPDDVQLSYPEEDNALETQMPSEFLKNMGLRAEDTDAFKEQFKDMFPTTYHIGRVPYELSDGSVNYTRTTIARSIYGFTIMMELYEHAPASKETKGKRLE